MRQGLFAVGIGPGKDDDLDRTIAAGLDLFHKEPGPVGRLDQT